MTVKELVENSDAQDSPVQIAELTDEKAKPEKFTILWTGLGKDVPADLCRREFVREDWIPDDWNQPFGDGENPGTGRSRLMVKPE